MSNQKIILKDWLLADFGFVWLTYWIKYSVSEWHMAFLHWNMANMTFSWSTHQTLFFNQFYKLCKISEFKNRLFKICKSHIFCHKVNLDSWIINIYEGEILFRILNLEAICWLSLCNLLPSLLVWYSSVYNIFHGSSLAQF